MKKILKLRVNGEDREEFVEPYKTLQDVLREELDLTGVKEGCQDGYCGVCTVLIDGKPVRSCLILAFQAQGRDILTIEGMAKDGQMHPLQEAFLEHNAFQCGFCTPGMILTAKSLLDENPHPTEKEVRSAIAGNLCRCTGYVKTVDAILATAGK